MKHLGPCILLRCLFLNFILVEVLFMAAGWTPVRAVEGSGPDGLSTAIRRVAEQNKQAVVHIEVTQDQEGLKRLGTGMFIDGQGHIITSNHVAGGATGDRGKEISDGGTFQKEVAISHIRQEANVSVFRGGKKQTLPVRIADRKKKITQQVSSIENRLGVNVRPVTPQEVERYGLDSQQGLVITYVHPDSPLADIGFEVNDMILEINGRSIDGLEGLVDLINALRPQQRIIMLGLDHRSGRCGYVQVEMP